MHSKLPRAHILDKETFSYRGGAMPKHFLAKLSLDSRPMMLDQFIPLLAFSSFLISLLSLSPHFRYFEN